MKGQSMYKKESPLLKLIYLSNIQRRQSDPLSTFRSGVLRMASVPLATIPLKCTQLIITTILVLADSNLMSEEVLVPATYYVMDSSSTYY